MHLSAEPPPAATPRVMATTSGSLFLAAALACTLVLSGLGQDRGTVLPALVAGAAAAGALLLRFGRHLPVRAFHGVVVSSSVLLAVGIRVSPGAAPALALASLGTFIAMSIAFYFTRRAAVAHLVLALVLQSVALRHHPMVSVGAIAALVVVCAAVAVVIARLVQRAGSASRDSLTGLANRRGFDDALQAAMTTADRTRQPLSVALIDVDHFKAVNDGLGHGAGDDLLRALAGEIRAVLPAEALVARHGGDEFGVLLPGTTGAEAVAALSGLHRPGTRRATSHGVAQHEPCEGSRDLLRRADAALYAAKAAGRQRTVLSSSEGDHLALDLAEAIGHGDVRVALQPILALPERVVVGVEALARWTHPEQGPIGPDRFVPAAEAADLIVELGALVLTTACRDALALCEAWQRELLLTVNVSGRELTEPGYADAVARVLAATGWPASRLVVEVTESLLDASSGTALQALRDLRRTGVRVAIDDFGTGYSSFSRLDTVPADYLKLDHSFISAITTSRRRAGMLTALIGLSETLGLEVVAEGVETVQQADALTRLGCPFVQGYLFGRPLPVTELIAAGPGKDLPPGASAATRPSAGSPAGRLVAAGPLDGPPTP